MFRTDLKEMQKRAGILKEDAIDAIGSLQKASGHALNGVQSSGSDNEANSFRAAMAFLNKAAAALRQGDKEMAHNYMLSAQHALTPEQNI